MFRYIAVLWEPSNAGQAQIAANFVQRVNREYKAVVNTAGMHVLCAGIRAGVSEPYVLPDITGVVLGTVFDSIKPDQTTPATKKQFSLAESRQIEESSGRCLHQICWGRYVAIFRDAIGCRCVFRDPLGALPCFLISYEGIYVCFSDMEDCARLGLVEFSIDWEFISARVVHSILYARETAIEQVSEILPGELVRITGSKAASRSLVWDPMQVALTDPIEDVTVAACELRRVALASIQGWARRYRGILLQLSGGLDSSIVLGCLRDWATEQRLTCLNYHSEGSDSDERVYARVAAQNAGCQLIERERKRDVHLEDMLPIDRSPSPTFYLTAAQIGRSEAQLAEQLGADAIFSGGGGDQLFYQARAELGAADYLALHGIDRRLLKIALNAARLERSSIWRILGGAIALRLKGLDLLGEGLEHRKLVTTEAIEAVATRRRFRHPRFDRVPRTGPPGKLWHALTLSFPTQFYDPIGEPNDPEAVQPLLCQPLVELCLRVPSYVLTAGGWDRAVARRAFENDVPELIIRRRTKGGMEENVEEILERNIRFVRELLLDGQLTARGFLDRGKLEEVLSLGPTRVVGAMSEIFDHLSIEVWLRRWETRASEKDVLRVANQGL